MLIVLLSHPFFLFARPEPDSIPALLLAQYQIYGYDLVDFFSFDLDGDEREEAIWLIWHQNQFQLIYHNYHNRCGQYQLSGQWKRRDPPQLIFQDLDEQPGHEILIYDLNQPSPLTEVIAFPLFEATPLLRTSAAPFFPTQFRLSQQGKWIFTINYQKSLELPSMPIVQEEGFKTPPTLKMTSLRLMKEKVEGEIALIQEWNGLIEAPQKHWKVKTRWKKGTRGWILIQSEIE